MIVKYKFEFWFVLHQSTILPPYSSQIPSLTLGTPTRNIHLSPSLHITHHLPVGQDHLHLHQHLPAFSQIHRRRHRSHHNGAQLFRNNDLQTTTGLAHNHLGHGEREF